jgi:hypothetical protein
MVRCKFVCNMKVPPREGSADGTLVRLAAVANGSKENEEFFKWTPGGSLDFYSVNDAASAQFETGKEYFIDISPVVES